MTEQPIPDVSATVDALELRLADAESVLRQFAGAQRITLLLPRAAPDAHIADPVILPNNPAAEYFARQKKRRATRKRKPA